MPISRQIIALRATLVICIGAAFGCAEQPAMRSPSPPMAVYLTIDSRLEGENPLQVAIGRSRIWNAPAPRADIASARPAGGHFRVSADTVRISATLDDGRPCRRSAVLESRREAWLDVVLEPDGCAIRIRYGVPAINPDSAPWLRSQILLIAESSLATPDDRTLRPIQASPGDSSHGLPA